jgi:chorismate mutase / prephenate dehydratase
MSAQTGDCSEASRGDLTSHRDNIDRIDAEILALLNERGESALAIGRLKHGKSQAVYAPDREQAVFARLRELNADGVYPDASVVAIYREVISASRALETPLRISYFGPAASFTHIAARGQFGVSVEYQPEAVQADVFREIEHRRSDYGVVPVANSTMGVVIDTLDLFATSPLQICGEIHLPIAHNLLSQARIEDVRCIYSHQQAFAQCREWLRSHLPGVEQITVSNTAEAARRASQEEGVAAVSSRLAADEYGLNVLVEHIEDKADNVTRFLVIGRHAVKPTGNDKTSVRFTLANQPGSLVRVLEQFGRHGIDLTKVESRPSPDRSWDYVFYADVTGHVDAEPLSQALPEVEKVCQTLKVLGSYPRA